MEKFRDGGSALDRYHWRYHTCGVTKRAKLLAQMRNNPKGARLTDLVAVLDAAGFKKARQTGSHAIYQHPKHPAELINLQSSKDGKAKPYQVTQVLTVLDRCKLEL